MRFSTAALGYSAHYERASTSTASSVVTAFRALYQVESFKFAFDELLELDPEERQQVVAVAPERSGSEDLGLPSRLMPALSAFRMLRGLASEDSAEDVVADITEVCSPEIAAKFGTLADVLVPTEAEQETAFVREYEESALPVLVKPRIYIDFRAAPRLDSDEVKLVPVVITRFEFDEMVGGGSALSFQASVAMLRKLRSEIDSAMNLLERSTGLVNPVALPDYLLGTLSDESSISAETVPSASAE